MKKKLGRILTLLLVLSAFACIIYYISILAAYNQGADRYRPERWVTLNSTVPATEQKESRPDQALLRIAVAPVISPARSLSVYTALADFLGAALNKKAVLILRDSYAEVNDLIRHRGCDLALVCTYSFVQGERDFGLELLAAPRIHGKNTYQCYIIVPAGSGAKNLFDLRGKTFASSDILSTSGWLYPAVRLLRSGENPHAFFSRHIITGSHDKTVEAVATGYVDGAAVHSLVYALMVHQDPALAGKITILERSPEYGMPPVVVHPLLDPGLKKKLALILLHMHETPEGEKILATLGIDCFAPPDSALYDLVRKDAAILESPR